MNVAIGTQRNISTLCEETMGFGIIRYSLWNSISPARLSARRRPQRCSPCVEVKKMRKSHLRATFCEPRCRGGISCYLCYGGGLEVHLCMVSWLRREKRKRNQFHTQLHATDTRVSYSVGPNHVLQEFTVNKRVIICYNLVVWVFWFDLEIIMD